MKSIWDFTIKVFLGILVILFFSFAFFTAPAWGFVLGLYYAGDWLVYHWRKGSI